MRSGHTPPLLLAILFFAAVQPALGAEDPPGKNLRDSPSLAEQAPCLDLHGRVTDKTPIPSRQENEDEARAYDYALISAHSISLKALSNSARRDVTYAHLFEEPEKYRGKVIHVSGRLKRVRRFDAPALISETYDLAYLYEGWLFEPAISGANPRCIIFSELPSGLAVQEEMDKRITFDGYFFKKYRYKALDGWRDAPLFIGRSPVLVAAAKPEQLSPWMLTGLLFVLLGTVCLVLVLAWWYRRNDNRVRAIVSNVKTAKLQTPDSEIGYSWEGEDRLTPSSLE